MAKIKLNTAMQWLSGHNDGVVYKRLRPGEAVAAKKAAIDPHRVWSRQQVAQRASMRHATAYAKAVWREPEQKAFYVAIAKQRRAWRAFSLAVGDFRSPPTIREFILTKYRGRRGDRIVVYAKDDIGVLGVEVVVRDRVGKILEQGLARRGDVNWTYSATTDQPPGTELEIEVAAWDRPGNRTVEKQTFVVPKG
jgi:hypothetical protein